MKYFILLSLMFLLASHAPDPKEPERDRIQIALLLDTSNSMDGLIEQAKGKLWTIVNEFAAYRKGDLPPRLEIALFEYGNDHLAASGDWLRQVTPFTTDLDFISQQLFELRTYGGTEYCGSVIHSANQRLEWSRQAGDLKLIFIAGNEPFNQEGYPYRESCLEATGKGIAVNTIFCGPYEHGIQGLWKEGATLGGGKYLNIDHNEKVTYVETPWDAELERLNRALNDTYIYYGDHGAERKANQARQDANAASFSAANAAERAVSKAAETYRQADWDLVDALEESDGDLKSLDLRQEGLPESLRGKSAGEIEQHILKLREERASIRTKIRDLSEKRRAYIARHTTDTGNTLDRAIAEAAAALAGEKGFGK